MNTKNLVTRMVVVFVVLALAGIGMVVGSRNLAEAFDQTVLIGVGSALFGAALTFFLIRLFTLVEK